MELWTTHHAEDSPMAKMSIKERADLVDQIGREIEVLERPENAKFVNAELLREAQLRISELFVVSLRDNKLAGQIFAIKQNKISKRKSIVCISHIVFVIYSI